MVKVSPSSKPWLFSSVYASSCRNTRFALWDSLHTIKDNYNGKWLIGGGFNELPSNLNKKGGNPINNANSTDFFEHYYCDFIDLGFKGSQYIWVNNCFTNRCTLIFERLDRFLANNEWSLNYLDARVIHLPRTHSDHCPLLLSLYKKWPTHTHKIFRLESSWASHPDFPRTIQETWENTNSLTTAIDDFKIKAIEWNKSTFGNIFQQKKSIIRRLTISITPPITRTTPSC